jgi:prophage antirepressor-like protein
MSIFNFDNQTFTLTNYGTADNIYFKAKDVALFLGYVDTDKAIRQHVWDINKTTLKNNPAILAGSKYHINTIYVNEAGLYQLIFGSKMPYAEQFQRWVFDVISKIRKTGQYKVNENKIVKANLTFNIQTEYDLHTQLINFIKVKYPNILLTIANGELQNDTFENRKKSYLTGYTPGTFDIIINNLHKHFSGFAIELKSPKGTGIISEAQKLMEQKYKLNGFKTLISNDYNECIFQIIEYMRDVRIKCPHCCGKFKTNNSLNNHLISFHKIKNV